MMKKILRDHGVSVLSALAIIFLVAIIAVYSWGIGYLIFDINAANNGVAPAAPAAQFKLDAAAKLDYRGTLQATQ